MQRRVSNSVTLSALSHKATPQSLSRTKSRSERLPRTRHRLGDMEEGHRGIVWPGRTPCGGSAPPGLAVPVARGGTNNWENEEAVIAQTMVRTSPSYSVFRRSRRARVIGDVA